MARITDNFFGSLQKEKLQTMGVTDNDEIEILTTGKFGGKMIRINGGSTIMI